MVWRCEKIRGRSEENHRRTGGVNDRHGSPVFVVLCTFYALNAVVLVALPSISWVSCLLGCWVSKKKKVGICNIDVCMDI